MGGKGAHESIQKNPQNDYSVIPQPLAKEVARFIDSQFIPNGIQRVEAVEPRKVIIDLGNET